MTTHEFYKQNDPEVIENDTLYHMVAEGGLCICKKCHKMESQLEEECDS